MYVREPAAPFVSMAEMMQKFQSNTRGMNLPSRTSSLSHADAEIIVKRKPKLTLTRPKEPDFETAQCTHPVKIKSSAKHEEEMMSKIPKFKARPVNKKNHQWKPHLTAPKTPVLQTSLRAHPPRIKSSEELEKEELEKAPKFKARPLNKKANRSYMALKVFCEMTSQNYKPNICTYTALVNAFARDGLCEKAEEIFEQLQKAGHEPDVYARDGLC